MNQSSRWPWVILISSIQLVLLLAGVVALFAWLSDLASSSLMKDRCAENQIVIEKLMDHIDQQQVRDIRTADSEDRGHLIAIFQDHQRTNNHNLALLDYGTGATLYESWSLTGGCESLSNQCMERLDGVKFKTSIRAAVSNQVGKRVAWGKIEDAGKIYSASAEYVPQLNAILVLAADNTLAVSQLQSRLRFGRSIGLAGSMLIGLIGICFINGFVTRFGETVCDMQDDLDKIVSDNAKELVRTKNAVIFGLAKLAESRDNDTGEHLERIRSYVTILAEDLSQKYPELDEDFIHSLGLASSLHDIGKVGIPDSILLKPGRLTAEEREVMELHTLIGGECLDAIHARLGENEFMHIARQIAYYHHERWDGTGYPHSLSGTEIPLVARITAVADVYDALTSKRPYKTAMTHQQGKDIIVAGIGEHFDPEVVEAFLRNEDKFELISSQQQALSDAEATSTFQRLCEAV